ncbi:MAG: leucyl aminopeptidase [Ignavibacteriaceae bacterium]
MFRLKIIPGGKKIIYDSPSISIKYLIDEKKLDKSLLSLEKIFNIKFSNLQKKNFLYDNNKQIRVSKPEGKPDSVIIEKIKIDDDYSSDYFRNHLAGLIQTLEGESLRSLHIFIPDYKIFKNFFNSRLYYYQTFVEGLILGNYKFQKYKTDKKSEVPLKVILHSDEQQTLKKAINIAISLGESINISRDLENEPGNLLYPELLAKKIKTLCTKEKIKVKIFNDREIEQRKMGGLLAVGMGSSKKPRFIHIEYKPGSQKNIKKVALVGKGVTFDSGGISLKPASKMGDMKADMSGAAVVIGTILAAKKNRLPVHMIGLIPAAENMPSGNSLKPGDIIKTASGKTIEVEDTDAEGRIILADALHYASKQKPDIIIDLATLTGACVVALGEFTAGLFTKNDSLANDIYQAGQRTFDRVWRLPLWDDFNKQIKSNVADIKNLGNRWGGAITAAKFLEHFVDKSIPWAHLDIAGPSFPTEINNYNKKYMTGFGVRLLFDYLYNQI